MDSKSAGRVWQVVGGVDRGGIVVRQGPDTQSPETPEGRLATGALVREEELAGDRLCFSKLSGNGPNTGWVSLRLRDGKVLLTPAARQEPPAMLHEHSVSRKLRILALHGRASNSNVMKFQVAQLKRLLGKEAEWLYLDARLRSDVMIEGDLTPTDASDFEKKLASGKPFFRWFQIFEQEGVSTNPADGQKYNHVEEAIGFLRRGLEEMHPIDVIVAFSQGSTLVSMTLSAILREGAVAPWRLSVFFSGGYPADPDHVAAAPWSHPTVRVWGGDRDPWHAGGEPSLRPLYTNLLELEHGDGHAFPTSAPRAGEIYAKVAEEVRRYGHLSS